MKRINNYVLNGALALLSTAGLVACSSSDDITDAPVNPTYDGKSVKTQFAINIATPSNGKTRMSDVNTQNKDNYLGMTNVRLLTLANTPVDNQTLLSALDLAEPSIYTSDNPSKSSYIYSDVNIPLTTSNFLFYSTRKDLGSSITEKAETGAIKSDLFDNTNLTVSNTNEIKFSSEPIISPTNSITAVQTAFAAYLNTVVGTNESGIYWSASTNETLKKAYDNFTKTYLTAQRAGSANAVRLQMQALYNIAKPIADNSSATDQVLARKLCDNILNSSATEANSIKFEDEDNDGILNYDIVDKKISNFPCEQGLPEGAALLTLNGSSFSYNNTPEIGPDNNKINISNITYPLPIVYFDNTPAKAYNAEISTWQKSTSNWDDDDTWTGWTDEVSATTRSIALKNNINYGVAGLQTVVKCDAAALEDNRNIHFQDLGNQAINVPEGGFEVTGILIGGQPNTVNWQFINTDANSRNYVVYDNQTNGVKAKASSSSYSTDAIYTLVFDNWISGDTQEKVTFALELKNGDVEFYGQEGVIAAGQKFYLIGQLDPANPATGSSISWPTYPDPQSGATGTLPESYKDRYPVMANTNRVFVQDFTTLAQVNIKSLKNAYVTIPDLRATKLQLGLSVDLSWRTGLTFEVPIE